MASATHWDMAGTQMWVVGNNLHRDGDLPARLFADGKAEWFQHGLLHRDGDLPAVTYPSGLKLWCKHGKIWRDGDSPTFVSSGGDMQWWEDCREVVLANRADIHIIEGEALECDNCTLHRGGDLPAFVGAKGLLQWWVHGQLRRGNGPLPFWCSAFGEHVWLGGHAFVCAFHDYSHRFVFVCSLFA